MEIRVERLGRPLLFIDGRMEACMSFSWCGGRMWASISGAGHGCGIDAAVEAEFGSGYPYLRAFSQAELSEALRWTSGNLAEAAALLWSAKEAVVKAMGCGFHWIDPVRLTIADLTWWGSTVQASARLNVTPVPRLPAGARCSTAVSMVRCGSMWVSGALIQRRDLL
jgi:phosphopantetheinyl transferase